MADPKERFFRHFQAEITLLQDEIDNLKTLSTVGGERQDGINVVLAGISRLSTEVMDATDFIPGYDQRTYSQAIKGLTEKLNETTGQLAPKSRFQFKSKGPKATGSSANPTPDPRSRRVWSSDGGNDLTSSTSTSAAAVDDDEVAPESASEIRDAVSALPSTPTRNYNRELSSTGPDGEKKVRSPSFSTAKNIAIYDQTGLHIILPKSASRATSSGSLTDLTRCIVDMTIPTSSTREGTGGTPFAGLALKNIKHSLIVAGHVAGPAHITGLEDCVVVVAARQVRIHECRDVVFYLHCTSHPIIEDCSNVRFAPLPQFYVDESLKAENNQWNKVDDFKWLKLEPSPNWEILAEEHHIPEEVWQNTVCGHPSLSTQDILRKVGITKWKKGET
ncbi:tubulin-specific chaperone C [Xylariaceae sp. FL0255]|nr:tubulin-specific chaperone C [Xylariaceae sp. FL0255]